MHLYRSAEDYVAAELQLTGGKFARNLAFSHWDSQTAHVALQPWLDDDRLVQLGLPAQTQRLLAHEAAHLVRFLAMPNYRSHPEWIADGSASWIDRQAACKVGAMSDGVEDVMTSTQIVRVQRLLASADPPTLERIFLGQLDGLGFHERYDITYLFFRFLKEGKHVKGLNKLLDRARSLGGGSSYAEKLMAQVHKTFNEKKMSALEEEFRAYVAEFEPVWEEVHSSLEKRGDDWLQTAFPETNALAWHTSAMDRTEYVVRGSFEILPSGKQQLNLLLNRSDAGFISIAFTANYGITVFDQRSEGNVWNAVAAAEVASLLPLTELAFEVRVAGKQLTVLLAGDEVIQVELPRELLGPWGLGAQAGTSGFWRGVSVD